MPNVFHDHLAVCRQCRYTPFDLCPEGRRRLQIVVDEIVEHDDEEHSLARRDRTGDAESSSPPQGNKG